MEKTLTIDGKQIRFKSTGATPLRYKTQFGTDFFVDLMKMEGLSRIQNKEQPSYEDIKSLDMEVFYNIVWVLAKTADKTLPEPVEWLDDFEEFPLMEIIPELQELLTSSMQSKKK